MPDTFKNRLNEIMTIRNIKPVELAKKTGLSKAQISQYTNGVYEAKQIALLKLAIALDVSEAWLMGCDVPMNRNIAINSKQEAALAKEVELIESIQNQWGKDAVSLLNIFVNLNNQGKEKALDALSDLSSIEKYTKH